MEKSRETFYIADYNNDCVRRLWKDGSVQKLISIHSRPFELGGQLYVAVHNRVYQVSFRDIKVVDIKGTVTNLFIGNSF